ncbi:RHS repeat-associated core domain-containing protein [Clostridium sp. 19966]|nr:RHS repeat-associated core domain-containing protein [Clostridium sp. 19966]
MNLNGVEYYYIRNGQSDIIGLFDKTGAQVVSYTYDTWGKLVSIDGSLKDTVGVKNPYRYRGYRYDTETGLYYLQSRYYNPDWGRFINADAIAGSVGELLGHNLFAYCKNSPVALSDKDGYRPLYCASPDEETSQERTESYSQMKKTFLENSSRIIAAAAITKLKNAGKNAALTVGVSSVDQGTKQVYDAIGKDTYVQINRNMRRSGGGIFIPGSKIVQKAKYFGKTLGVAYSAYSIIDDVRGDGSVGTKVLKVGWDAGATFISGVAEGIPVAGPVLSIVASSGFDFLKGELFG